MARTYIAASYSQRYCESSGIYVALRPLGDDGDVYRRVEAAAAAALDYEESELPGYCEGHDYPEQGSEDDCPLCHPDLILSDAYDYRAKDLFTLAELRYWMHELAAGTVIYLAR